MKIKWIYKAICPIAFLLLWFGGAMGQVKGISRENVSGVIFNNFIQYGEVLTVIFQSIKIGNFTENIQFVKGQ